MDPNKKALTITLGNITPPDLFELCTQLMKSEGQWFSDGMLICSKASPFDPWKVDLCPRVASGAEFGKSTWVKEPEQFGRTMELAVTKRLDRNVFNDGTKMEEEPEARRIIKGRRVNMMDF
jgi:hypothetical protein